MENQTKLINYLPEFLRDIREYKALTTAEDYEINLLWADVGEAFNEQTVDTATEYGISRLEKIMNIIPKSMDMDERKTEIKTRLGQQLPYTEQTLRKTLDEFCGPIKSKTQEELAGYILEIFPKEYTLKVLISLWNKNKKSLIDTMIRQICPANMLCMVDLKYNTYGDLQKLKLTYEQLSKLTYKQIREEVLEYALHVTHEDLSNLNLTYEKIGDLTHKEIQVDYKSFVDSVCTETTAENT